MTNKMLYRLWSVRMTGEKFFSCLSVAEAEGMQKDNFCLFLNGVHLDHP